MRGAGLQTQPGRLRAPDHEEDLAVVDAAHRAAGRGLEEPECDAAGVPGLAAAQQDQGLPQRHQEQQVINTLCVTLCPNIVNIIHQYLNC